MRSELKNVCIVGFLLTLNDNQFCNFTCTLEMVSGLIKIVANAIENHNQPDQMRNPLLDVYSCNFINR